MMYFPCLPPLMFFMHPQTSVMIDSHQPWCRIQIKKLVFSFLWRRCSRTFYALPQPDRLNASNAYGSIQRFSLRLSLVSGPHCFQMTSHWPCQKQAFSKGLRAMKNAFQDEGFLWDLLSMESMESHWLLAMLTKQHHTECKQPSTGRHLSLQTMQTATGDFSSVHICDLMHCGKKAQNIYYFSTSTNSARLDARHKANFYQMLSLSTPKRESWSWQFGSTSPAAQQLSTLPWYFPLLPPLVSITSKWACFSSAASLSVL